MKTLERSGESSTNTKAQHGLRSPFFKPWKIENTPYIDSAILKLRNGVYRRGANTRHNYSAILRVLQNGEKTAYTAVKRRDQGGMRGFIAISEKDRCCRQQHKQQTRQTQATSNTAVGSTSSLSEEKDQTQNRPRSAKIAK